MSIFGGPSPPPDPAAQAASSVAASQWQDYMQQYLPQTQTLMNYATSNTPIQQAMQTAQTNEAGAQTQAAGISGRQLANADVMLTPQEKQAQAQQTSLGNAAGMVGAINQAKDTTFANQMGIMGTPMSGITGSA